MSDKHPSSIHPSVYLSVHPSTYPVLRRPESDPAVAQHNKQRNSRLLSAHLKFTCCLIAFYASLHILIRRHGLQSSFSFGFISSCWRTANNCVWNCHKSNFSIYLLLCSFLFCWILFSLRISLYMNPQDHWLPVWRTSWLIGFMQLFQYL